MKVLVIGAARSGTQVSLLLRKQGVEVFLTDLNEIDNKTLLISEGVQVYDGGHPEHLKEFDFDFIVKNPGIPYHAPFVNYFVQKQVPIYNEIEIASRFTNRFTYGAITGTNGKTTTTTLLSELLKRKRANAQAAGNIGIPLSEIVMSQGLAETDVAVEIAGFQLVGIKQFHPIVSVCMNLSPDHLDYFGSLENYYRSKFLIYQACSEEDWFLRNIDDLEVMRYAVNIPCRCIDFSLVKKADLCIANEAVTLFNQVLFQLSDLHLPGKHNLQNAMVAAAMAYKMGVSIEDIQMGIRLFKGVEHRIEYVAEIAGVTYYNDSKGTNVDATIVALSAFDQPVILIAGGYDKKTGFKEMIPYMHKVKKFIVYGATKFQLQALDPSAIVVNDLYEATHMSHQVASKGDIVLFSPICASWDQFHDFEQRGRVFKEIVHSFK